MKSFAFESRRRLIFCGVPVVFLAVFAIFTISTFFNNNYTVLNRSDYDVLIHRIKVYADQNQPNEKVETTKIHSYRTTQRSSTIQAPQTTRPSKKPDCPVPLWSKQIQGEPWYPLYVDHLQRVDLSGSSKARIELSCARWWHPSPQKVYGELPDRGIGWKPNKKPPNYTRPDCTFGQKKVPESKCARAMAPLWKRLEEIEAVYYPRDGTELGAVRQSSYISSDGDMDIFVDVPQELLHKELVGKLKPPAYLSGKGVGRGVHWKIKGCPIVHIHFSDWTGVERSKQSTHDDTCNCYMNSVLMACHKEGPHRLFTEYGPSWKVPLHSKHLDCVLDVYKYTGTVKKLKSLVGKSGLIEEENVRALDRTIEYDNIEMAFILAHLNIVKAQVDSGKKYKGQSC